MLRHLLPALRRSIEIYVSYADRARELQFSAETFLQVNIRLAVLADQGASGLSADRIGTDRRPRDGVGGKAPGDWKQWSRR